MICRYWWNQQEGKHKIHWVSWDLMIKPKKDGGLGFRHIHGFNMAMLSKQAWRLVQSPDSLCSRVLQAKYYTGKSCLEAQPKTGISYSWRSILSGIDLLKKGLIWRVGDGENLNIWKDPWLPRDMSRRPITPRGACLLCDVAELIDPTTGSWDVQMVRDIFWEEDARIILALPVHGGMSNLAAWHFDKKGVFSVKSAYKVYRDDQQNKSSRGGGSASQPDHGYVTMWKKLWGLNCAGKIKHFLWRLAYNSHPLRMNLKRRGMDLDTRCVVCRRLNADGAHVFFRCKTMERVWGILGLEHERSVLAAKCSARDVIEAVLAMKENTKLKCCLTLRYCWGERNRVRDGEQCRDPSSLAHGIQVYMAAWCNRGSEAHNKDRPMRSVQGSPWEKTD